MVTLRIIWLNGHESPRELCNPHIGIRTWVLSFAEFYLVRGCFLDLLRDALVSAPYSPQQDRILRSVTRIPYCDGRKTRAISSSLRAYPRDVRAFPSVIFRVCPGQALFPKNLEKSSKKVS